jgi:hypothetical protein
LKLLSDSLFLSLSPEFHKKNFDTSFASSMAKSASISPQATFTLVRKIKTVSHFWNRGNFQETTGKKLKY